MKGKTISLIINDEEGGGDRSLEIPRDVEEVEIWVKSDSIYVEADGDVIDEQ